MNASRANALIELCVSYNYTHKLDVEIWTLPVIHGVLVSLPELKTFPYSPCLLYGQPWTGDIVAFNGPVRKKYTWPVDQFTWHPLYRSWEEYILNLVTVTSTKKGYVWPRRVPVIDDDSRSSFLEEPHSLTVILLAARPFTAHVQISSSWSWVTPFVFRDKHFFHPQTFVYSIEEPQSCCRDWTYCLWWNYMSTESCLLALLWAFRGLNTHYRQSLYKDWWLQAGCPRGASYFVSDYWTMLSHASRGTWIRLYYVL